MNAIPANIHKLLDQLEQTDGPAAMLLADEIYDLTANEVMSDVARKEIGVRVGDRLEQLGIE